MTDIFPVTLAGAFDALDLAIPTKPRHWIRTATRHPAADQRSLRLAFRCNACSDTPGRAMTLDIYADL
jgi:hypothetical protein